MFRSNISLRLFIASTVVSVGISGCHHASSQPASNSIAPVTTTATLKEIHIDQKCQILEGHGNGVRNPRMDPSVCHFDYVRTSHHLEETVKDGTTRNNVVTISEQEYLLHNVTAEPVTFVVEQLIPEGWQVDSDPQPTKMVGQTALFRANAQPGETVRLHVGERQARPITLPTVSTNN
jgi:hypothetical protein